ncbi:MAG: CDF family Co(II)/Ni(II) efflux transporter DmeF [Betaproteobacteria bacterium]|nr:CDF family Co(II)/Ni(II) efflux transporter DmeF [Betaproteobacteria bacterium]
MHIKTHFPCTHNRVFDTGSGTAERSTWIVTWITAVTMVVEIAAGWWFNSMALLADGWHMSSHTLAIGLSAVAYAAARRYAGDSRFAFGTWKIEVLSGFASAIFLLGIAAMMVVGSTERIISPQPIHYREAMLVAVLGLAVNLACALILARAQHGHGHAHSHHHAHGTHHDLNMKSAYIHVLTDALTSVLAIIALAGGWLWGWNWLDPVMGIIGAILVAIWAKGLIIETGKVLLDREMDHPIVHEIMDSVEAGDTHINDLHVWRVGKNAYSCAISAITHDAAVTPAVIRARLAAHREIVHSTIELCPCPQGRSNNATDSTCEVCGNMLAMPAPRKT